MGAVFLYNIYYAAGIEQIGAVGEQALSLADKYTLSWILNLVLFSILMYGGWLILTDRIVTRKNANDRVLKEREVGEAKLLASEEKLKLFQEYREDVDKLNERLYQTVNKSVERVEATTKIASQLKPAKKDGEEDAVSEKDSELIEEGG